MIKMPISLILSKICKDDACLWTIETTEEEAHIFYQNFFCSRSSHSSLISRDVLERNFSRSQLKTIPARPNRKKKKKKIESKAMNAMYIQHSSPFCASRFGRVSHTYDSVVRGSRYELETAGRYVHSANSGVARRGLWNTTYIAYFTFY